MTALIVSESGTRYLEDLFLHLRGCSRRITASYKSTEAACVADRVPSAGDALVAYENDVSDFLATIAPAAVERLRLVQSLAPGYAEDPDYPLSNLKAPQIDQLVRPLFEATGILDDFIPWQERFPDLEAVAKAAGAA